MRYYKENIGVFRLDGKDVTDFLQRVSTNDLNKLSNKSTLRTVLLNDKGKIVDFVTLLKYDDVFMLIASAGNEMKGPYMECIAPSAFPLDEGKAPLSSSAVK